MRQVTTFIDDGGRSHENIQDAHKGDAWHAIETLINSNVPYSEYIDIVVGFIDSHGKQLYELLRTIHEE